MKIFFFFLRTIAQKLEALPNSSEQAGTIHYHIPELRRPLIKLYKTTQHTYWFPLSAPPSPANHFENTLKHNRNLSNPLSFQRKLALRKGAELTAAQESEV
ncbi:deoxyuridine 5'-triphosphate nucleotidohydrolase [Platysternon megacephalum]|uniref:Deoxyuridine 5'-triphosphate nucleotidohydrolase n=1 Tax=Platysternon megacephalum TaxID=55544 RepID=A0A4D9DF26_9SAUR|nr:deoxyuridine 5'-triphosphate nucleotidohydrolase [Platysternon megacephalum]